MDKIFMTSRGGFWNSSSHETYSSQHRIHRDAFARIIQEALADLAGGCVGLYYVSRLHQQRMFFCLSNRDVSVSAWPKEMCMKYVDFFFPCSMIKTWCGILIQQNVLDVFLPTNKHGCWTINYLRLHVQADPKKTMLPKNKASNMKGSWSTGWWFQIVFYFQHEPWGSFPFWRAYFFQMGWLAQPPPRVAFFTNDKWSSNLFGFSLHVTLGTI